MIEWVLGNTLVAGLFALVVLALGRFNRSRPAFMHLLWGLALAVLLAPRLPFMETPGALLRAGIGDLVRGAEEAQPERRQGEVRSSYRSGTPSLDFETSDTEDSAALASTRSRPADPRPVGFEWPELTVEAWLFILWGMGALVVLARSGQRVLGFQRLVRETTGAPLSLRRRVDQVALRMGIQAPEVRLLLGVASPSIWCFGRPLLLWPADDSQRTTKASRSTLIAHELAHLARRDHWVSWLEVPAAALLWWNPLFWLIRGRIRHYAELACDAWAVWAYPADRRAFAEALIDMQARTVSAPVAFQGLGATDSEFKDFERRLNMIMKKRGRSGASPRVNKGAATLAVIAAALVSPGFSDDNPDKKITIEAAAGSGRAVIETQVKTKQLMEKAEYAFQAKDYDAALKLFSQVVALNPEHGAAHGRMGYILVGNKDLKSAEKHFLRQNELGYARPTALYNLGCTMALAGQTEKALKYVATAVQHGFDNADLMASDTDLDAIRNEPMFAELSQRVADVRDLQETLWEVKEAGDEAAFLDLHTELAHIRLADGELQNKQGHLALKAKDYKEAARAFGQEIEVGHGVPTAYYNRACARSLAGDLEGALADLERSAAEGMVYAGIQKDTDLDNVRQDARFAALQERISTSDGTDYKQLKAQLESGDPQAMYALQKVAKDEKRSKKERAWASQTLGRKQLEEGRYEDALASFERAAAFGEAVETSAFHLAQALEGLGDSENALRHVEYAVDLGFTDADAVGSFLEASAVCSAEKAEKLIKAATTSKKKSKEGYGKEKGEWGAGEKKKKKKAGYAKEQA